jgi:hypothetical protein
MRLLTVSLLVVLFTGCGSPDATEGARDGLATVRSSPTAAPSSDATFRVALTGAIEADYAGDGAVAGARYGRYHVALVGGGGADAPPRMVISFAHEGTERPAAGTYAVGSGSPFSGSLEIYSTPQREFSIGSGELEITGVDGDELTGRFTFTAQELAEEYGAQPVEVQAVGSFRTRAAN